ncbi:hypothetical protein [Microcoleus vaginatus]|uniref:hypothetical protein n=1 Tax=Microcoleus vaginatus TaxID=119532 RepID=UPI001F6004A1
MTFPIAMWRVSQKEKFRGFHVKSLTIERPNPANAVANAVAKGGTQSAISSPAESLGGRWNKSENRNYRAGQAR